MKPTSPYRCCQEANYSKSPTLSWNHFTHNPVLTFTSAQAAATLYGRCEPFRYLHIYKTLRCIMLASRSSCETKTHLPRCRARSGCADGFRADPWPNQSYRQAKNNRLGRAVLGHHARHRSNRRLRTKSDSKLHRLADQWQTI